MSHDEPLNKILDTWCDEEPPPGLAARTLQALEHERKATPPWLERLDRLVAPVIAFFEGPRHPLATGLATLVVGSLLMLSVLAPNLERSRAQGELIACRANLKNLGIALEAHHQREGRYPETLEALQPGYLKVMPSCPASEAVYGYQHSDDRFTVLCRGQHHAAAAVGKDYPQYSSEVGAVER